MKKTTKSIVTGCLLASALLLQGCFVTTAQEHSSLAHQFQFDSAITRVVVEQALPKSVNKKIVDLYQDDLEEFQRTHPGYTFEQFLTMDLFAVGVHKELGHNPEHFFIAPPHLNVQVGDILDVWTGSNNLEELAYRTGSAKYYYFKNNNSSVEWDNDKKVPQVLRGIQFLAFVCRAGQSGCSVSSSKKTQVGAVRRIESVEEYRGPENEFANSDTYERTLANQFGMCGGCKDDDEKFREWMREQGYIQ